ncbi:DUF402 domain-containing protein [Reinekea sp. G2M2-21]|uniref:DUF402 domain-containing protein n=1 Tax=Reinekea sp. G2M2-21 TaxID=2788942 RepID=UPI0018AAE870|nr:DUF402 domain-containing protein [Reinekea sp. G2M2-21]
MLFKQGQKIQLREMIGQKPWAIREVDVLEDRSDQTLLWYAEGSRFCITEGYLNNPEFANQRWQISQTGHWNMIESQWKHNHVLIVKNLTNFYSVQLFWRACDNRFLGYYVNFELPYRRVCSGFDTLDLDLDIIVHPDMTTELKDEDEYLRAVRGGYINREWTEAIQRSLQSIYSKITGLEYPFDGSLISRVNPLLKEKITS